MGKNSKTAAGARLPVPPQGRAGMGGQGLAYTFNNPHGRLGELAGFKGRTDVWYQQAQARLHERYQGDPDMMILSSRHLSIAVHAGRGDAAANLEEVRRDYAAHWLIRQIEGVELPHGDAQKEVWQSAIVPTPDRQLALTLAVAGFDVAGGVLLDETPALHAFVYRAECNQLDEFLSFIPPEQRMGLINTRKDGITAVHVAALGGGAGCLACLQRAGGDMSALLDITLPDGEVVQAFAAHLAVMNGCVAQTAELMAIDRGLFTRFDSALNTTPVELVETLWQKGIQVGPEMRKAANIAAHAVDRPVPFPEFGWVLKRLGPGTAPAPVIARSQLN